MGEPATGPQLGYVIGLSRQLRQLLEQQGQADESARLHQQLEAAQHETISKQDASRLIDTLIKAVEALGGDASPRRSANVVSMQDSAATRQRERWEAQRAQAKAYETKEISTGAFNGARDREPFENVRTNMTVWKRKPNKLAWSYASEPEIEHGWTWVCTHPDHAGRGSGKVQGGSYLGWRATLERAYVHYRKYHVKDGT
jgi:hypothetical protein